MEFEKAAARRLFLLGEGAVAALNVPVLQRCETETVQASYRSVG